jgi:hypothetical protein
MYQIPTYTVTVRQMLNSVAYCKYKSLLPVKLALVLLSTQLIHSLVDLYVVIDVRVFEHHCYVYPPNHRLDCHTGH